MAALFGRRLRRGATTTAVAALAVAALSASQAPAIVPGGGENGKQASGSSVPDESPDSASGDSSYHTDLPPLNTPDKPGTSIDLPDLEGAAEAGIPATVLSAYKQAEQRLGVTNPGCNLPWQLLAAIGKVESGQARGGRVDDNGTTFTPILGPVLNGVGFANISDTDNGAYDGDKTHDRAVGPMQFIPSTWATWGQDANGDGRKDPNNIFDAALAAGRYLCANNRDLSLKSNLDQAILSYNRSREYLATVLSWLEYYKRGSHEVPDGTGVLPEGPGPLNPGGPSNSPSPGPTTSPSPDESPTTNPPKPPSRRPRSRRRHLRRSRRPRRRPRRRRRRPPRRRLSSTWRTRAPASCPPRPARSSRGASRCAARTARARPSARRPCGSRSSATRTRPSRAARRTPPA